MEPTDIKWVKLVDTFMLGDDRLRERKTILASPGSPIAFATLRGILHSYSSTIRPMDACVKLLLDDFYGYHEIFMQALAIGSTRVHPSQPFQFNFHLNWIGAASGHAQEEPYQALIKNLASQAEDLIPSLKESEQAKAKKDLASIVCEALKPR